MLQSSIITKTSSSRVNTLGPKRMATVLNIVMATFPTRETSEMISTMAGDEQTAILVNFEMDITMDTASTQLINFTMKDSSQEASLTEKVYPLVDNKWFASIQSKISMSF